MKRVRLISYVIFACFTLFHNLSAGITYVVELKLGDQSVFLWGDHHNTHEIDEDEDEDEDKEHLAISAFCKELESVETETLILCEDFTMAPFSTICSEQDCSQILFPTFWDKAFMSVVCNFAHRISNPQSFLQAQSIDPRGELVDLVSIALNYSVKNLNQKPTVKTNKREHSLFDLEKKVYDAVKNGSISGVFELLITNIKLFSEFTSNSKTKIIFDAIANRLKSRKVVLWNKLMADTGLSQDELDQATIQMVGERMKTDTRYIKLADLLTNKELMAVYSEETVDADALWYIAGKQNPCKKIIVVAGAAHIYNLEKHLISLGFKKGRSAGKEYKRADRDNDKAILYSNIIIDKNHKSRIAPLPLLDEFGNKLFKDEISAAWKEISQLPEEACTKEINRAIQYRYDKINIFRMYDSPPLVPFDTFKWINHKEKKRKRSSTTWVVNKKSKHS